MSDGVEVQQLVVDHGCKRVMLKGGRYGGVLVTLPASSCRREQARPDWMIEDVIIDGVELHAPEIAFEIYGQRIAIVRSKAHAGTYSVWSAPAFELRSEDIVIAGNHLDSAGPEATVRLVGVVRSVTVDNVLRNTRKHNYRIHGDSEFAYAARNILIDTGAMLGTMDEDHINKLWFDHNTFFQQAPDLFNPSRERIGWLHAEGNTAYDDTHRTFIHEPRRAGESATTRCCRTGSRRRRKQPVAALRVARTEHAEFTAGGPAHGRSRKARDQAAAARARRRVRALARTELSARCAASPDSSISAARRPTPRMRAR